MRNRDVHRADGFFLASAARARHARDAHAERAANAAPNAVGQRNRPLRWLTAPFDLRISGGTSAQAVFSSLL